MLWGKRDTRDQEQLKGDGAAQVMGLSRGDRCWQTTVENREERRGRKEVSTN